MNVYDFDGTIYNGDCTLDFWKFCVRKYPKALLALPGTVLVGLQFKLGLVSREYFKESFYQFLRYVPDTEKQVKLFWDISQQKIKPWYYQQCQTDDLIISASPEFLIAEICGRLKLKYIASKVDCKCGKLMGANCRSEEKVRRFRQIYLYEEIEEFYSDSQADEPMAKIAKQAFAVKGDCIKEWYFRYGK